ncbi:DUF4235 domain-containing protein [Luteimicrobium subarcticum]|uniref:Uncharacterized protein DUF4235 n=1 Tax=Luteimicrobium subarcticum TaxID=620910 RepID=A0A2M8W6X9_9MICO|nr:DUF4235 domain-containing protein [Luteimicrobium subarcticum]PJI86687.1 uncharacterized protein DUF4235 [Luteimicrobium subarcticum]
MSSETQDTETRADADDVQEIPQSSPDARRAAKILYKPFGIASSVVGGLVAARVFRAVYKKATPGDRQDPPTALQSEYRLREILIGAALQGAIYAVVKASIDRAGARVFQRWTGEWPGD